MSIQHKLPQPKLEEWEKEFDARYYILNSGQILLRDTIKEGVAKPINTILDIKSFIIQLLTQAREEGKLDGETWSAELLLRNTEKARQSAIKEVIDDLEKVWYYKDGEKVVLLSRILELKDTYGIK